MDRKFLQFFIAAALLFVSGCRIGGELLGDDTTSDGELNTDVSTVTLAAPKSIVYEYRQWSLAKDEPAPVNTPSFEGDNVTFTATLPEGLSIDASTGVISGTPTLVQDSKQHPITVTNSVGSKEIFLAIRVVDGFQVNSTDFTTADAAPGDGQCDIGGGVCTLRASFEENNAAAAPKPVVISPGHYYFDKRYEFEKEWNVFGNTRDSVSLDGDKSVPLFLTTNPALDINIVSVTMQNGYHTAGGGGIISVNGAGTSVTVSDFTMRDSKATSGGGAVFVGVDAAIVVENCLFERNEADGERGGAIRGQGNVFTRDCLFLYNVAERGGAIALDHANALLNATRVHFEQNRAVNSTTGHGGALDILSGGFTIVNSSFYQNKAKDSGGAIRINSGLTNTFVNVTMLGNEAFRGGAILSIGGGTLNLANMTIVDNTAYTSTSGGGAYYGNATVVMAESIVAGNRTGVGHDNCHFTGGTMTPSENIVDTSHADCSTGAGTGDEITDPLLGEVGFNGGGTVTVPLRPGSPAIDNTGAACTYTATDQRQFSRDSNCDIGAFEVTDGDAGSPPRFLDYGRSWFVWQRGKPMPPLTPTYTASGDLEFVATAVLPPGITIDLETGVISGTPKVTTSEFGTFHFLTLSNADGYTATTLRLAILDGFEVDSDGDTADTSPGDGQCIATGGGCTLRAAIAEANALKGKQIITFAEDITSIHVATALPTITTDLAIVGNGGAPTLTSGLTHILLTGADAGGTFPSHVDLSDFTYGGGTVAFGGMINSNGRVHNVLFENFNGGGPALTIDSGVYEVTNSTFSGNVNTAATLGGAMFVTRVDAGVFEENTFVNNQSTHSMGNTGALFVYLDSHLIFASNKFYNNSAGNLGGAVYVHESTGVSAPSFINNTFSSNSANQGGAIASSAGSNIVLINNLFYNNDSVAAGGGALQNESLMAISGNVFEGNTSGGLDSCDGAGTFSSMGFNLMDTDNPDCNTSAGTGDIRLTAAGFTETIVDGIPTYSFLGSSAAADALSSAFCAQSQKDVLGNRRIDTTSNVCDIGPVEIEP